MLSAVTVLVPLREALVKYQKTAHDILTAVAVTVVANGTDMYLLQNGTESGRFEVARRARRRLSALQEARFSTNLGEQDTFFAFTSKRVHIVRIFTRRPMVELYKDNREQDF